MAYDYLIWSFEHKSWWRGDEWGYTQDVSLAGRFTVERASDICHAANVTSICRMKGKEEGFTPQEAMVPVPEWLK